MRETGIIGDIHGCLTPLKLLVKDALPHVERFVFLGDYVNRGKESRQVLDFLIELAGRIECHFLAGNHDLAMLAALGGKFDEFLTLGGASTVRSYINPPFVDVASEFCASVAQSHREFLNSLAELYSREDLLVTHRATTEADEGPFRVFGHSPQPSTKPLVLADSAYIDTGCGTLAGGRLTCFLWPSRTWLSQPEPGR
ncbi:MAG: metallophosphoesterase [Ilumatobacteraceae bacterium]